MTEIPSDLQAIEDSTFKESDSFEFPPPEIVAYNELRSCADLYRMYSDNILEIRPHFQREIVWSRIDQTRFIDSLVKQLPIPSMCFSFDFRAQKWQVIDGLQRMWCIISFLRGDQWYLSRLEDIDPELSGEFVPDFIDIDSQLRHYYSRIQNLTLPITVIRCDYSKTSHMDYLFTIFHRLNTGAVRLNNQEIRNCIFSGTFNNFLKELDKDDLWRTINGRSANKPDRYRGQEQILRFFAFQDKYHAYNGRLAKFLNEFMMEHREPNEDFIKVKSRIFNRTISLVHKALYDKHYNERVSMSVKEATLVGVALNIDHLEFISHDRVRKMHGDMLKTPEFSEERLREGLSGRQRVLERMTVAEEIFSN